MKGKRRPQRRLVMKLQRSLFSSDGSARVLMYDKQRKHLSELPLSEEVAALMGEDLKGYFSGWIDGQGQFVIEQQVPDQDW